MRAINKSISGKIVAVLLVVVVSFAGAMGNMVNVSAKSVKKTQIRKYQSIIKQYDKKLRSQVGENLSNYGTYYAYVDIDKNGVYELILRYDAKGEVHTTVSGSVYGDTTTIYTIKNGKVKTVEDRSDGFDMAAHTGTFRIYKNKKIVGNCFGSDGVPDCYYRYREGKLSKSYISMSYISAESSSSGKVSYVIGNKTVSKNKYNKQLKKLIGSGKGYKMKQWK